MDNNKKFYEDLINACNSRSDCKCGVQSSSSEWSSIFGSTSYCYGQSKPLWYMNFDNANNFDDFVSFGCWTAPWAKQYQLYTPPCGIAVNLDYIPSQ